MKLWQADLAIFGAACLWGLSFVFTFWGMEDSSPAFFLLCRFGVALAAALILFGRFLKGVERTTLKNGLILGFMLGAAYLLQTYSIKFTDVSRAAFIAAMTLPAIPVLNWLIYRAKVNFFNMCGIALALAGLYFLLGKPSFGDLKVGDIIAFCSIPLWALYMIYINRFTEGHDEFKDTARMLILQLAGGLPLLIAAVIIFESGLFPFLHPDLAKELVLSKKFIGSVLFCAILASLAIAFIQTACQKYTTPVQAMLIFQFEPITATAASVIFALEPSLSNGQIIGAAIIISGVLFSELGSIFWQKKKV